VALSSINSNTSAIGLRGLDAASKKQTEAITELVSGLRINKAADDAAGLSISTQLQAQLRGLNSASGNGQNAVSLLQVADGGLDSSMDQLQRVRDLTVQAANTDDPGALDAITKEIGQSLSEVDRISQTTTFGSQNLLDGSLSGGTKFQLGPNGGTSDQFNVSIPAASHTDLGLSGIVESVKGGDSKGALSAIDDAIKNVNSTRTDIGAATNALGNAVSAVNNEMLNTVGADSQIMDADYVQAMINGSLANIQAQAGVNVLTQSSANDGNKVLVGLLRS
jgi:flagellin